MLRLQRRFGPNRIGRPIDRLDPGPVGSDRAEVRASEITEPFGQEGISPERNRPTPSIAALYAERMLLSDRPLTLQAACGKVTS